MEITIKLMNNVAVAIINSNEVIINDGQSALDLVMSVQYETEIDKIVINKEAINENFFILSTGLAGEILQKLVNYHIKFAIIGDFSSYSSKPLKDFIYECNNGKNIFFVSTKLQAIKKLTG